MTTLSYSRSDSTQLAIVVPCYNESEVFSLTLEKLLSTLDLLITDDGCARDSFIVFIDDGSKDSTWDQIEIATQQFPRRVRGVRLARNVGHQGALLAGLEYVTGRCDAAISIDADLQDDLNAMHGMIREYKNGAEMVLGVRDARDVDTWFKRNTALAFYRVMRIMGVDLVENHADFRLMSSKALKNLARFPEFNLFLRGMTPLLHKRIATVTYSRGARAAGESKYPLRKMLALAWNGITSFSVMPLRMISMLGAIVFLGSLAMSVYALVGAVVGANLPGWTSITVPLYLLGGMIMLSVGIVGEYLGKLFLEVKGRPRFLVDFIAGEDSDDN
jgi:glycosyltransferase involved in cell wall biosynthesis